jgi:hypothetical protein
MFCFAMQNNITQCMAAAYLPCLITICTTMNIRKLLLYYFHCRKPGILTPRLIVVFRMQRGNLGRVKIIPILTWCQFVSKLPPPTHRGVKVANRAGFTMCNGFSLSPPLQAFGSFFPTQTMTASIWLSVYRFCQYSYL